MSALPPLLRPPLPAAERPSRRACSSEASTLAPCRARVGGQAGFHQQASHERRSSPTQTALLLGALGDPRPPAIPYTFRQQHLQRALQRARVHSASRAASACLRAPPRVLSWARLSASQARSLPGDLTSETPLKMAPSPSLALRPDVDTPTPTSPQGAREDSPAHGGFPWNE